MGGSFEEEDGGLFSFSEGPIRVGLYKCTWIALTSLYYGGFAFWTMLVFFQLNPLFRLSTKIRRAGPSGEWALFESSLLIGLELGLLGMVGLMTVLVPTLIMTWITALVFEYIFGRYLFRERRNLIQEGSLIAKDITWMAVKSLLKQGNVWAVIVLIFALLACGIMKE